MHSGCKFNEGEYYQKKDVDDTAMGGGSMFLFFKNFYSRKILKESKVRKQTTERLD